MTAASPDVGAHLRRAQALYQQSLSLYVTSLQACAAARAACDASMARRHQEAVAQRGMSPQDAMLLFQAATDPVTRADGLQPVVRAVQAVVPGVELGVVNWSKFDALIAMRARWHGRLEPPPTR